MFQIIERFLWVAPKVILGTVLWETLLLSQHFSQPACWSSTWYMEISDFFLSILLSRTEMLCPMENDLFDFTQFEYI